MSTFDLHIRITGLCLYVPRKSASGTVDRIELVLPDTSDLEGSHNHAHGGKGGGGGHREEKHVFRLVYDTAYLREDQTSEDGVPTGPLLDGHTLSFPRGAGMFSPALPTTIATIKRAPKPEVLAGSMNGAKGRIILSEGGFVGHDAGACWKWQSNEPRRMGFVVDWLIEGFSGASLRLLLDGSPMNPPLFPIRIDGENQVRIRIYHAMASEISQIPSPPPEPPIDGEGFHFKAYRKLFPPPVIPLPLYHSRNRCEGGDEKDPKGMIFTCMSAQVEPQ